MASIVAKARLDELFERAVREAVSSVVDGAFSCRQLPAGATVVYAPEQPLVVLTISSYKFQIISLFQFQSDPSSVEPIARLLNRHASLQDEQALLDAFDEAANMICGAVKRYLDRCFPHIGMSTPFVLDSACANHLQAVSGGKVDSYEITVNNAMSFRLTVCLVADDELAFDFHLHEQSVVAEESSGELELF